MNALGSGTIFFVLQMSLNSALSAEGNTRLYRNFLIFGCLANCGLNPFFMWGWLGLPAMGVAGIGLATVLVQIGGCILLWRGLREQELFRRLPAELFRPQWRLMREIAAQATPAALNMLTIALGIFVISWFVKHFGKEAMAASGIATRIEQFVLMPAIGLNTAVLSLVGQNHGAGLHSRVRETWLTNIKYGVGVAVTGGILQLYSISLLRVETVHRRSTGFSARSGLSGRRSLDPAGLSNSVYDRVPHAGPETPGVWPLGGDLPPIRRAAHRLLFAGLRPRLGSLGRVVGNRYRQLERRALRALLGLEKRSTRWWEQAAEARVDGENLRSREWSSSVAARCDAGGAELGGLGRPAGAAPFGVSHDDGGGVWAHGRIRASSANCRKSKFDSASATWKKEPRGIP